MTIVKLELTVPINTSSVVTPPETPEKQGRTLDSQVILSSITTSPKLLTDAMATSSSAVLTTPPVTPKKEEGSEWDDGFENKFSTKSPTYLIQSVMATLKSTLGPKLQDLEPEIRESAAVALVNGYLIEFVKNAMDAGAQHFAVCVKLNGEQVIVTVADDGPGFPKSMLPDGVASRKFSALLNNKMLFASTKKEEKQGQNGGAGQGMAELAAFCEAIGATFLIGRSADGGAEFSFTSPLNKDRQPFPIATVKRRYGEVDPCMEQQPTFTQKVEEIRDILASARKQKAGEGFVERKDSSQALKLKLSFLASDGHPVLASTLTKPLSNEKPMSIVNLDSGSDSDDDVAALCDALDKEKVEAAGFKDPGTKELPTTGLFGAARKRLNLSLVTSDPLLSTQQQESEVTTARKPKLVLSAAAPSVS